MEVGIKDQGVPQLVIEVFFLPHLHYLQRAEEVRRLLAGVLSMQAV